MTASVPAVPLATLVILLPAALIPVVVTLGPPVMARPLLSSLELPVITEANSGLSAIWISMLLSVELATVFRFLLV
ncbi:hypothetical protein D3C81_2170760 [compost metagenome]